MDYAKALKQAKIGTLSPMPPMQGSTGRFYAVTPPGAGGDASCPLALRRSMEQESYGEGLGQAYLRPSTTYSSVRSRT